MLWLIAVGMTNDRHLAEDIVQETLAVAWNKVDAFDPETSFAAWTARIVRNIALNYRRKASKQSYVSPSHLDATPSEMSSDYANPIDSKGNLLPDQRHFDDQVLSALGDLSSHARCCLLLRTVNSLSYEHISKLLDIPPGTAMSHVYRARRAIRKSLSGSDVKASGSAR